MAPTGFEPVLPPHLSTENQQVN